MVFYDVNWCFYIISLLRLLLFVYLHYVCIERVFSLEIVQVDVFPWLFISVLLYIFYIYFKVQDTEHTEL